MLQAGVAGNDFLHEQFVFEFISSKKRKDMRSYNLIWYHQGSSKTQFYFKHTGIAKNGQKIFQASFNKPEGIIPIDLGENLNVYLQVSFGRGGSYSLNAHVQTSY